ncbi:2-methylaconitate cis-trans isomerase PrpF [Paraburkholderia gardini]|uniref:2-methylaconitate cis-trans isomerase PrpF n=1 Tax=Paraburkholderia gardini TaxID=2823469 RepID=UPI001DB98F46|nr:2-methylaconitate cis-trans isomerase PrpF [Paraburkholderia gardini]CAG4901521.1 2-methyl-aconitate isomerase [Paraburkholderia gardini]
MQRLKIPAVYMRGGTSKGVFFRADVLPQDPLARDQLLLRITGSPDRYGKQIDGMGGGTSSTSKVVIVSRSARADSDVDYWFGAVSIDTAVIDWSGNCGNLSAAVGPFAINEGLVDAPANGMATVRIWQANLGKHIIAHVPMHDGEPLEAGDFELDGIAFSGAEIKLEFIDPAGDEGKNEASASGLFPTGVRIQTLDVPGVGAIRATLINAGNPTVFIDASSLGLSGIELQADINPDRSLLDRAEAIRAHGAVAMGLSASADEATRLRPATPKLAFVARAASYVASDGKAIRPDEIDLVTRIFSMGQLHHAMTGTGAVALAVAAAIPDTIVSLIAPPGPDGLVRFGHPSGTLTVGAEAHEENGVWIVTKAVVSRSARRLMEGVVCVPVTGSVG